MLMVCERSTSAQQHMLCSIVLCRCGNDGVRLILFQVFNALAENW